MWGRECVGGSFWRETESVGERTSIVGECESVGESGREREWERESVEEGVGERVWESERMWERECGRERRECGRERNVGRESVSERERECGRECE